MNADGFLRKSSANVIRLMTSAGFWSLFWYGKDSEARFSGVVVGAIGAIVNVDFVRGLAYNAITVVKSSSSCRKICDGISID